MYTYCIHGLNIQSTLALKDQQDPFSDSHLRIEWLTQRFWLSSQQHRHALMNSENQVVAQIGKHLDGALSIDYFHCGFFYFKNQTLHIVQETCDDDFFQAILTTQILPLLASLKYTTLHGGAVLLNSRSLAFLGPEGFGKSTLTTYLQKKNFGILSDDVVSVDWHSHRPIVYKGLPEIRLNQDSFENLHNPNETRTSKLTKWSFAVNNSDLLQNQLKAIFVLNPQTDATGFTNKLLPPQEGLQHLLRNQFRLDIWNKDILKREFHDTTKLLTTIPLRELSYPFEYSSLPWIEQQIQQVLFDDTQITAPL